MVAKNDNPLMTVYVITYNQERFVREALASVLAQTYSPLEIIVSDDASTDRTFGIIQEMAAAYRGPHELRLNRNEKNLGISGNLNKVWSMARGELVFNATGSDISMPTRVSETVAAWQSVPGIYGVTTDVVEIGEDGRKIDDRAISKWRKVTRRSVMRDRFYWTGSSAAYSIELYRRFGPMSGVEDLVCYRRGLLLGNLFYLRRPLVQWRMGGVSNQREDWTVEERRLNEWRLACSRQARQDLLKVPENPFYPSLAREGARLESQFLHLREMMDARTFGARFAAWLRLMAANPNLGRKKVKWFRAPYAGAAAGSFYNKWS